MEKTENNTILEVKDRESGLLAIEILTDFIKNAEYCQHAFFWTSPNVASVRRRSEEKFSRTTKSIQFCGNIYEFAANMVISAKNCYFSKQIFKNGKKTNLRTLRNLLQKLNDKVGN